jgi:hypothetical protein
MKLKDARAQSLTPTLSQKEREKDRLDTEPLDTKRAPLGEK